MKKLLVAVSREHGTDGLKSAKVLAEKLGVRFVDNEVMAKKYMDDDCREYYTRTAEAPEAQRRLKNVFKFLGMGGEKDELFKQQSAIIGRIAEEDGAAVFVGRCADYVLRGYTGLVRVFVYANSGKRVKKVAADTKIPEAEAKNLVKEIDKSRSDYYNYYTGLKWGDKDNYDLCINASDLTPEEIADVIIAYIEKKVKD